MRTEVSLRQFQSTLPHGERRRAMDPRAQQISEFQSTLPHGERPSQLRAIVSACEVSIHAPARGATRRNGSDFATLAVSIHAPARGATADALHTPSIPSFDPRSRTGSDRPSRRSCAPICAFQSTLPHGERQGRRRSRPNHAVSIHAPARGATALTAACTAARSFRSTLPHGERRSGAAV